MDNSPQVLMFLGVSLPVSRVGDSALVPIEPICASLGLDAGAQYDLIKGRFWSDGFHASLKDSRGTHQFYIDVGVLPMWLACIESGDVDIEHRGRLATFQIQCMDVLRRSSVVLR